MSRNCKDGESRVLDFRARESGFTLSRRDIGVIVIFKLVKSRNEKNFCLF